MVPYRMGLNKNNIWIPIVARFLLIPLLVCVVNDIIESLMNEYAMNLQQQKDTSTTTTTTSKLEVSEQFAISDSNNNNKNSATNTMMSR